MFTKLITRSINMGKALTNSQTQTTLSTKMSRLRWRKFISQQPAIRLLLPNRKLRYLCTEAIRILLSTVSHKFIISLYETSHTKDVQNYTQIVTVNLGLSRSSLKPDKTGGANDF